VALRLVVERELKRRQQTVKTRPAAPLEPVASPRRPARAPSKESA
jgi:hypothetical protein